jgi:hypothetical protein
MSELVTFFETRQDSLPSPHSEIIEKVFQKHFLCQDGSLLQGMLQAISYEGLADGTGTSIVVENVYRN